MKYAKLSRNVDNFILSFIVLTTFLRVPNIELQLALFGDILIKDVLLKLIVLLVLLFRILLEFINKGAVFFTKSLVDNLMLFFCLFNIVILPISFLVFNKNLDGLLTLIGYNMYLIFVALYYRVYSKEIEVFRIIKWLKIFALLNVVFGGLQHMFDTLIWPYRVLPNGENILFATVFEGNNCIRSTGLMTSGYELGCFLVGYYFFLVCDLMKSSSLKDRLVNIFYISITVFIIYFTYTRNVYVLFIYGNIFFVMYKLLKNKINRFFGLLYPIIFNIFLCGSLTLYKIFYNFLEIKGISSTTSFEIRLENWKNIFEYMIENIGGLLLGYGKAQIINGDFLTDNYYIDMVLSTGIIGLFFIVTIIVYVYMENFLLINREIYFLPLYLITSSIFVIGMFNLIDPPFELLGIVLPCCFKHRILN